MSEQTRVGESGAPSHAGIASNDEREQQLRLAELMNNAGIDEVKTLDTDLRILSWNRMCETVTGIPSAEAIGKGFLDIYPAARQWPAVMEALEQGLRGRRSFVPSEKGAYVNTHSEQHFLPLKAEYGTVLGIMLIIHDVAHRVVAENKLKALNAELQQNLRALERANAELATFTHVTSHDLKEPLRKIYTFVEMTITEDAGKLSDKAKSNLRRVQSSVQRMGLLTDDLVMFAEISSDGEPVESLDLTSVLQDAQKPLRKSISESNAVIEADNLPTIAGPCKQYTLLVQHLLSNAVKFVSPGTQPRVRVEAETVTGDAVHHPDAAPEVMYNRISVSDNGIGIEDEYFDKIFTLFQRLHGKGEYGGTGIGLAVVKKIVERRGGFITVESTPGAGSTFTCWLPVVAPVEAALLNEPEAESVSAG